jgi:hypothetical protein
LGGGGELHDQEEQREDDPDQREQARGDPGHQRDRLRGVDARSDVKRRNRQPSDDRHTYVQQLHQSSAERSATA